MSEHEKPYYGKWIIPDDEQGRIQKLMEPYQNRPVTEELRKEVYEVLSTAKARGEISIPFRIVLQKDAYGRQPDCLKVILDTKL